MKKFTLIIFSLCLFVLGTNNVFAKTASFSSAEYLSNISYVKYDNKYYHFRNAMAIRNLGNGNIAYCIEPFATLVDGSSYNGYTSFNSKFNLSLEEWNRIKLLVYYGYGYKGHSDQKWITITQLLIWRTVDHNSSFNWIDNVTNRNVIYPYEKEIVEIESLIEKHYILPDVPVDIKMGINDTAEFVDSNNVITDYKIKSSDFDAEIVDNKLVINSSDVSTGYIILVKNGTSSSNNVEFFYSSGTQSIVERGNLDPIEMKIKVEVFDGSISIKKIDSNTLDVIPSGEASLVGAIYDVYDESKNLIGEIVIDEDNVGVLDNLKFGTYYVRERVAGNGYYLDKMEYAVEINYGNLNNELILSNEVISSKIRIYKQFGSKEEYNLNIMKPESGIVFEFYNKDNELVYTGSTDEFGLLEVTLPFGKYVIKQVNSTSGYSKVEDIHVDVNENSNVSINLSLSDLKIEVPNAGVFEVDFWFVFEHINCLLEVIRFDF